MSGLLDELIELCLLNLTWSSAAVIVMITRNEHDNVNVIITRNAIIVAMAIVVAAISNLNGSCNHELSGGS